MLSSLPKCDCSKLYSILHNDHIITDSRTVAKIYWEKLENGKRNPIIPSLLINNKQELDFKVKANS